MKNKFSKFPWNLYTSMGMDSEAKRVLQKATVVDAMLNPVAEMTLPINGANARLIACAPELFEFVRDVHEVIACFCRTVGEPCFRCRANAFMRKIEGEQP